MAAPLRFALALAFSVLTTMIVFVCLFGLTLSDREKATRLSRVGLHVEGTVTAVLPNDHATITYSFEPNGRAVTGSGSVSGANPRPGQLHPGDRVHIVYDPNRPEMSCACSPRDDLANIQRNNLLLSAFGAVAGGVLSYGALTTIVQRRLHP